MISWDGCLGCMGGRGESTDDESGDLHQKGIVVVRADGTPCTACPADDFGYGADCEDLCG